MFRKHPNHNVDDLMRYIKTRVTRKVSKQLSEPLPPNINLDKK